VPKPIESKKIPIKKNAFAPGSKRIESLNKAIDSLIPEANTKKPSIKKSPFVRPPMKQMKKLQQILGHDDDVQNIMDLRFISDSDSATHPTKVEFLP